MSISLMERDLNKHNNAMKLLREEQERQRQAEEARRREEERKRFMEQQKAQQLAQQQEALRAEQQAEKERQRQAQLERDRLAQQRQQQERRPIEPSYTPPAPPVSLPFNTHFQFDSIPDPVSNQLFKMAEIKPPDLTHNRTRLTPNTPEASAERSARAEQAWDKTKTATKVGVEGVKNTGLTIGGVLEGWSMAMGEGAGLIVKDALKYAGNPVARYTDVVEKQVKRFTYNDLESEVSKTLGGTLNKDRYTADDLLKVLSSNKNLNREMADQVELFDWLEYMKQEDPGATFSRREILGYIKQHENYNQLESQFDKITDKLGIDLTHPIFARTSEAESPELLENWVKYYSDPEKNAVIIPHLQERRKKEVAEAFEKGGTWYAALINGVHTAEDLMVMMIGMGILGQASAAVGRTATLPGGLPGAPVTPGYTPGGWARKLAARTSNAMKATAEMDPRQYKSLLDGYQRMFGHAFATTPGDLDQRFQAAATRVAYNATPILANATGLVNWGSFGVDILLNSAIDMPTTIDMYMSEGGFTPAFNEYLVTSIITNVIMSRGTRGLMESQRFAEANKAIDTYAKAQGISPEQARDNIQRTNRALRDAGLWMAASETRQGQKSPAWIMYNMLEAIKDERGSIGKPDPARSYQFRNDADGAISEDYRFKITKNADGTYKVMEGSNRAVVNKSIPTMEEAKSWTETFVKAEVAEREAMEAQSAGIEAGIDKGWTTYGQQSNKNVSNSYLTSKAEEIAAKLHAEGVDGRPVEVEVVPVGERAAQVRYKFTDDGRPAPAPVMPSEAARLAQEASVTPEARIAGFSAITDRIESLKKGTDRTMTGIIKDLDALGADTAKAQEIFSRYDKATGGTDKERNANITKRAAVWAEFVAEVNTIIKDNIEKNTIMEKNTIIPVGTTDVEALYAKYPETGRFTSYRSESDFASEYLLRELLEGRATDDAVISRLKDERALIIKDAEKYAGIGFTEFGMALSRTYGQNLKKADLDLVYLLYNMSYDAIAKRDVTWIEELSRDVAGKPGLINSADDLMLSVISEYLTGGKESFLGGSVKGTLGSKNLWGPEKEFELFRKSMLALAKSFDSEKDFKEYVKTFQDEAINPIINKAVGTTGDSVELVKPGSVKNVTPAPGELPKPAEAAKETDYNMIEKIVDAYIDKYYDTKNVKVAEAVIKKLESLLDPNNAEHKDHIDEVKAILQEYRDIQPDKGYSRDDYDADRYDAWTKLSDYIEETKSLVERTAEVSKDAARGTDMFQRQQAVEEKLALERITQQLLTAKLADMPAIAEKLTEAQAKEIIARLDAAPGDNMTVRLFIYNRYPDLDPTLDKGEVFRPEVPVEPVKAEPVKAEPVEPAKVEPAKVEPAAEVKELPKPLTSLQTQKAMEAYGKIELGEPITAAQRELVIRQMLFKAKGQADRAALEIVLDRKIEEKLLDPTSKDYFEKTLERLSATLDKPESPAQQKNTEEKLFSTYRKLLAHVGALSDNPEKFAEYRPVLEAVKAEIDKRFPPLDTDAFMGLLMGSEIDNVRLQQIMDQLRLKPGSNKALRIPNYEELMKVAEQVYVKRYMPFENITKEQNEEVTLWAQDFNDIIIKPQNQRLFRNYQESPDKVEFIINVLENPSILTIKDSEIAAKVEKYGVTEATATKMILDELRTEGDYKAYVIYPDGLKDALEQLRGADLANPDRSVPGIREADYDTLATAYRGAIQFAKHIEGGEYVKYRRMQDMVMAELGRHRKPISNQEIEDSLKADNLFDAFDSNGNIRADLRDEINQIQKRLGLEDLDDIAGLYWMDRQWASRQQQLTQNDSKDKGRGGLLRDWLYHQTTSTGRVALNMSKDMIDMRKVMSHSISMIDEKNYQELLTKANNDHVAALAEFQSIYGRDPVKSGAPMIYQLAFLGPDRAYSMAAELDQRIITESREFFRENDNLKNYFKDTSKDNAIRETYTLEGGQVALGVKTKSEITLTVGEMASLYMHLKGDLVRDETTGMWAIRDAEDGPLSAAHRHFTEGSFRLENNPKLTYRLTDSDLEKIVNDFADKYADAAVYADWLFNTYNTVMRKFVNTHTEQYAGLGLAVRDNYVPFIRYGSDIEKTVGDKGRFQDMARMSFEHLGLLQERQENSRKPLYIEDALSVFTRYKNHAKNLPMVKVMYDYERMMKTGAVQREVEAIGMQKHLDSLNKMMNNITTFAIKEYDGSAHNAFLSMLRRNWTKTKLAANPWVAMLQVNSYVYAMAEMDAKYWSVAGDRKTYQEIMKYSAVNGHQRYGLRYIDRDLVNESGNKKTAYEMANVHQNMFDKAFQPKMMLYADSKVLMSTWNSIKKMVAAEHGDLSKDEQMKVVASTFDWLVAYSQPTALPHTRGLMAQSDNEFAKFMTMFFSQRQKIKDELMALPMDWKSTEDPKEKMLIMKRFLSYGLIGSLLKELRDRAMDKTRGREVPDFVSAETVGNLIEGVASYFPGLGQIWSAVRYKKETGSFAGADVQMPALEAVNDIITVVSLFGEAIDQYQNDPYYAGEISFTDLQIAMADNNMTEEEATKLLQGDREKKWTKTLERALYPAMAAFDSLTGIPLTNYFRTGRDIASASGSDGRFFVQNYGKRMTPANAYDPYFEALYNGKIKDAGKQMDLLVGPEFYGQNLEDIEDAFGRYAKKKELSKEDSDYMWEMTIGAYKHFASQYGLPTDEDTINKQLQSGRSVQAKVDVFDKFRSGDDWQADMLKEYNEAVKNEIDTSRWSSDFYELLRHGIVNGNADLVKDSRYVLEKVLGRDWEDVLQTIQDNSRNNPELSSALDEQAFGFHHNYGSLIKSVVEDAMYTGKPLDRAQFDAYLADAKKLNPDFNIVKATRTYSPLWDNWHDEDLAVEAMKWLILTEFNNPLFPDTQNFNKIYNPSRPTVAGVIDSAQSNKIMKDILFNNETLKSGWKPGMKEKMDRIYNQAYKELDGTLIKWW